MHGETTPMMKQYLQMKAEHPDCILMFRLGDFYEMFNEDAKLVSQVGLCCAAVCLVTGAAGFVYPPLLFVALLMLFLCLLMNVISSVLSAGAHLREENELTI